MYTTTARLPLPQAEAEAVVASLCAHLAHHDAAITPLGEGRTEIQHDDSRALVTIDAGMLTFHVEVPSLEQLQQVKAGIVIHLSEYAPPGALQALSWEGDGLDAMPMPEFRLLTVIESRDVTPHMRRLTFSGENLAPFASPDSLHVSLFIPPAGAGEVAWPQIEGGLLQLPRTGQRPVVRKYTIRAIDPAAGTLAIDFVLHAQAGPASAFAAGATPGQVIGMAGLKGGGLKAAGRYLFFCDETGLPALARMLETLPEDATGEAFVEVADAGESQPLLAPSGLPVRWLYRDGAAPGSTTLLQDAFAGLDWPAEAPRTYLWVATEYAAFRELRKAARQRMRPDRDGHLIVSFWRAGLDEDQFAAQTVSETGD